MVDVIVERTFEQPVELGVIQAIEDRGAWCLKQHRVRFVRTWFSKDRCRMICLYEAPDAEAVRIAQGKAGLPFDRAWSATRYPAPEGGPPSVPLEHVVVERTFEEPIIPASMAAIFEKVGECLPRHRAAYLGGHIASDGRRMICVFGAPDAESIRIANRVSGAPFDRAWSATLHEPAPPE